MISYIIICLSAYGILWFVQSSTLDKLLGKKEIA